MRRRSLKHSDTVSVQTDKLTLRMSCLLYHQAAARLHIQMLLRPCCVCGRPAFTQHPPVECNKLPAWQQPLYPVPCIRPCQAAAQLGCSNACVCCRCSVYTACLAATSICASATATPVVAADTTAPVITVRAPAANSVNATGYVATTVYIGTADIACLKLPALQYLLSCLLCIDYVICGTAHIDTAMQQLAL